MLFTVAFEAVLLEFVFVVATAALFDTLLFVEGGGGATVFVCAVSTDMELIRSRAAVDSSLI